MQKGGHFDILNVLGEYFISHEKKWTFHPKRKRMVALLNNAVHMRPVDIWVLQTQNPPVRVETCVSNALYVAWLCIH